jgi:hypothetical protein
VCEGGYELLEGDVKGRNALKKKKNLNLHHQNFEIAHKTFQFERECAKHHPAKTQD